MSNWGTSYYGASSNGGPKAPAPASASPQPASGPSKALGVFSQFQSLVDAVTASPPPNKGDGLSQTEAIPETKETGIIQDLVSQGMRVPQDLRLLINIAQIATMGGLIDDKTYFMERLIQLVASLPPNSKNQLMLTGQLVKTLWTTLEHPPLSYMSKEYKYRCADGSHNNIMYPSLGKAGTPYARSVKPQTIMPPNLPDPGVLFDTLFSREDYKEHPTKTSSMLFYLASLIIHDCFRTSTTDSAFSSTSSYLDLAPLYGNSIEENWKIRTGDAGKIKPDCFLEPRILGFPPGVGALLVCFNRYHNYAVTSLAEINEGGKFTKPPTPKNPTDDAKKAFEAAYKQWDEDLFQTGRLITCGLYVNIILNDYVKNILGFNFTESSWTLDPRSTFGQVFDQSTGTPMGVGNQVAAEFNLIYRWHAAVSAKDAQWTEDFYRKEFGIEDPDNLTVEQVRKYLYEWGHSMEPDPSKRTFGDLKRKPDGKFPDKDLVDILSDATEDCAGSFGSKNIPRVLRAVEMMGILQARDWKLASLNEFREFCGLQRYKTFEDISSDPKVANALRSFYNHPDFVEMYVGMNAEDSKKQMIPGSGLCPGFTISRAILSDAVALVRGDRFYTVDYTPATLTNWGYTEVAPDPNIVQGRVMYKLLHAAFPGWYDGNSVYAMYPFTVPSETAKIQSGFGKEGDFSWVRPHLTPPPTPIVTYKAVKQILGDPKRFKVPWGPHTRELTGHDYMLSGDEPWNTAQRKEIQKKIYVPNSVKQIREFYISITTKLLQEKSYDLNGIFQVDAVRDVGNAVQAHFAAEMFHIPLKTQENPLGILTEQELYTIYAVLFAYVFLDLDPSKSYALKQGAHAVIGKIKPVIEAVVKAVHVGKPITFLKEGIKEILNIPKTGYLPDFGKHFISRLLDGHTVDETVAAIIPTMAAAVATQGQGFAQMMDVYLSEPYYSKHWPKIQQLAHSDTEEAFQKLRKYGLEGYRLNTAAFGLVRIAADDVTIVDGKREVRIKKGEHIFTDFVHACIDPEAFPNPLEVDLNRPEESYIHHGYGPASRDGAHKCLGFPIVVEAMASMLKVFGKLDGLRRTPGPTGHLKYVMRQDTIKLYMKEDESAFWPFPANMKVQFDHKPF